MLDRARDMARRLPDQQRAHWRVAMGYAAAGLPDESVDEANPVEKPRLLRQLAVQLARRGACQQALEVTERAYPQAAKRAVHRRAVVAACARPATLDLADLEDDAGSLPPSQRLWTLSQLARTYHAVGRPDDALRLVRDGLLLVDQVSKRLDGLLALARVAWDVGAGPLADTLSTEALALAAGRPAAAGRSRGLRYLLWSVARGGERGRAVARRAAEALTGSVDGLPVLERVDDLFRAAETMATVADPVAAERYASAASRLARGVPPGEQPFRNRKVTMPRWALSREAEVRALMGQPEAAAKLALGIERRWRPFVHLHLGMAAALGPERARELWATTQLFAAVGVVDGWGEGRARAAAWLAERGDCEAAVSALEGIESHKGIVQHLADPVVACVDEVPRLRPQLAGWLKGARRLYVGAILRIQAAAGDYDAALQSVVDARSRSWQLDMLVAIATIHHGRREPLTESQRALVDKIVGPGLTR